MQTKKPLKRRMKICVAIPASIVTDIPHLREKTLKVGFIGRAFAIFRVNEVMIYPDQPRRNQRSEMQLIATLLSYVETPQYLRRHLFKIMPELRYAGTLPPLRTPHHPLQNRMRDLKNGECREGVVISIDEHGAYLDIGIEKPILMEGFHAPLNTRVTVKIVKTGRHPKVILVKKDEIDTYWGYDVTVSKRPFGEMVKALSFDLVIVTSRRGKEIVEVICELKDRFKKSENVLVAFGAPTQGLYEIAEKGGFELESMADYVVNTIPNQATETVRTEEAIYATLSIFNILMLLQSFHSFANTKNG